MGVQEFDLNYLLSEEPDFQYLNNLGDDALKESMLEIFKKEIHNFLKLNSEEDDQSIENQFIMVHKLSSKFSLLGMEENYKFVKKVENNLKEGKFIQEDMDTLNALCENLLSIIE